MRNSWFTAAAVVALLVVSATWATIVVHGQIAVHEQGYIPFTDQPINYRGQDLTDPVARLQKRLAAGTAHLEWNDKGCYLPSILRELHIPVSSQTLVFSKTSFQYKKISPQTPRALYFNDDVYVGFVNHGRVLEFVSFDPLKGAVFYLMNAQKQDHPAFERAELDCTQCHISDATHDVPGVFVRSVYSTSTGTIANFTATHVSGQETPLRERWGGWYVTGRHGSLQHMGNVLVTDPDNPEALNTAAGANLTSLKGRFDDSAYLSDQSDIVAHLVLDHQTQMHNLITRAGFQQRIAAWDAEHKNANNPAARAEDERKWQTSSEELLQYLLFQNEAPLDGIQGTTTFAQDFAALGPRDRKARSLRDFDLQSRIFRYPCSYLIYSDDWDALPGPVKLYLYHRLYQILSGSDQSGNFTRLTAAQRQAIFEILLDTKPDLPAEWKQNRAELLHASAAIKRWRAAFGTR